MTSMIETGLNFLFLRAINTGSRRVTNDELLAPLIAAGFADVAAFQAAGNITLRSEGDTSLDAGHVDSKGTGDFGRERPALPSQLADR